MSKITVALVLDSRDNVATLLGEAEKNETIKLKGTEGEIHLLDTIGFCHKVSLKHIKSGQEIFKYGQKIGIATEDIQPGEWIHLHNMTSAVDLTLKKRIQACSVKH